MNSNLKYLADKITDWKTYLEDKHAKTEGINDLVGEMQYVLNLMDYWYASPKRLKTNNKK